MFRLKPSCCSGSQGRKSDEVLMIKGIEGHCHLIRETSVILCHKEEMTALYEGDSHLCRLYRIRAWAVKLLGVSTRCPLPYVRALGSTNQDLSIVLSDVHS